ncbi:MAG: hypothetical protein IJB33_00335 [Akkermansia sp.]|nr:hypothetical protein [Akkermansia sp.]
MKHRLLALAYVATTLAIQAQESNTPTKELPNDVPGVTMTTDLSWFEIDPGVRSYLILLTANTMELSAALPDGGVAPTPEQQFDIMEKVVENTPLDSLTGEYRQYVEEANAINRKIIATLKAEKPTTPQGVMEVRGRYLSEIEAINAKYPQAGKYFNEKAQMAIALMLMRETEVSRVAIQAAMAGKNQQETMKTVVEHLRRVAADQQ